MAGCTVREPIAMVQLNVITGIYKCRLRKTQHSCTVLLFSVVHEKVNANTTILEEIITKKGKQ